MPNFLEDEFTGGDPNSAGIGVEVSVSDEIIEVKAADEIVENIQEDVEEVNQQLSEVERRFELAQYYKLLLKDRIFNDNSEYAKIVEKEVRSFVRDRLEILLGISSEKASIPAPAPFSDQEVAALKMVAGSVIKRPQMLEKAQNKRPTVEPKKPPTLNRVEVPQEKRSISKPKPTVVTRQPKTVTVQAPVPEPETNESPIDDNGIIKPKKLVMKPGRKYKKVVVDGKEHIIDVTPQAKPTNAKQLPMPNKAQMEQIYQQKALQETQMIRKNQMADSISNILLSKG